MRSTEVKPPIDDPLLFACILDGKGGGTLVDWDTACAWDPQKKQGAFLWLHIDQDAADLPKWLGELFDVPERFVKLLTSDAQQPSVEFAQGMLGLALRVITSADQLQWQDMRSLRLWSDSRRFITMGCEPIVAPRRVLADIKDGTGPVDAGALLTMLVNYLASEIADVITSINTEIDTIQNVPNAKDRYHRFEKLTALRHGCLALERHIGPQHTILERIVRQGPGWIAKEDLHALRDTIGWLERFVSDLKVSETSIGILLDELMSRATFNANHASYMLSLVAGIFLPLTFLTGLLGINVGGIPGANSSKAFLAVVGVCFAILLVQVYLFRRWKWF